PWPQGFDAELLWLVLPPDRPPKQPVPEGPSICPPKSYTTCTPVFLKRVLSDSATYQLNNGKVSLKLAWPLTSVNSVLLTLPLRKRIRFGTWSRPGSPGSWIPLPFKSM